MPLRSDPTAWFNLPGIVAAYQPIAAPGPLIARYNQAHGGDNRYKAVDGTAPTWAGHTGWIFNNTQYLSTQVADFNQTWTTIIRVSGSSGSYFYGARVSSTNGIIVGNEGGNRVYYCWGSRTVSGNVSAGVMGHAGKATYLNGRSDGTIGAGSGTCQYPIFINVYNNAGTAGTKSTQNVQAFVAYARTLSPAEVLSVSRQMAYCEKNPDWSAWGRRRKWYLSPSVAGTVNEQSATGASTPAGAVYKQTQKRVGAI